MHTEDLIWSTAALALQQYYTVVVVLQSVLVYCTSTWCNTTSWTRPHHPLMWFFCFMHHTTCRCVSSLGSLKLSAEGYRTVHWALILHPHVHRSLICWFMSEGFDLNLWIFCLVTHPALEGVSYLPSSPGSDSPPQKVKWIFPLRVAHVNATSGRFQSVWESAFVCDSLSSPSLLFVCLLMDPFSSELATEQIPHLITTTDFMLKNVVSSWKQITKQTCSFIFIHLNIRQWNSEASVSTCVR